MSPRSLYEEYLHSERNKQTRREIAHYIRPVAAVWEERWCGRNVHYHFLSVFVFSVAVHFRKFQCVWECAGCGSGEGICVIVWPSQPSHELLGPGSDTEAGFVRAFGTPRSLVHTTARGYTNAHTHHTQTKAQNGWEGDGGHRDAMTWWKGSWDFKTKQIIYTLHLTSFSTSFSSFPQRHQSSNLIRMFLN